MAQGLPGTAKTAGSLTTAHHSTIFPISFGWNLRALQSQSFVAVAVVLTLPPTQAGPAIVATLDDTCGNLIQIYQV